MSAGKGAVEWISYSAIMTIQVPTHIGTEVDVGQEEVVVKVFPGYERELKTLTFVNSSAPTTHLDRCSYSR